MFGALLSTLAFAQEKFLSDNFSHEEKELNTSMKSIGFTTVLPSNYTKYEDIVAVIDSKDDGLNDYYTLNFYYNILPVSEVAKGGKVKYLIESGTSQRSDFTSVFRTDIDAEFEVFHSLDFKERAYRYQTVVVKIMGRVQDGMKWENDQYVTKYRYEKISLTEIKLDLGKPEPTYTTDKGLFTYEKYNDGKGLTKIYSDDDTDNISVIYEYGDENTSEIKFTVYEVAAGEIKQESVDMSGAAPEPTGATSPEEILKEIKINLKKSLIKSSCYSEARSVKITGQRIGNTKINKGIYGPYMLDAEKKKASSGTKAFGSLKSIGSQFVKLKAGNDKYSQFLNSPESKLDWKQIKIGGANFELLELDFYQYKQCTKNTSNNSFNLKEGQEGITQKVFLITGIVDGRLFIATFTKDGKEEMNQEDIKFKDFVLSTFNVNK